MALGYLDGRWPPNEQSPQHAVEAMTGLLRAHAAAAAELHRALPGRASWRRGEFDHRRSGIALEFARLDGCVSRAGGI